MVLTLNEKEKLLEKATKLYEEIAKIKIRKEIKVDITRKYYASNSRYAGYGFTYYMNGGMYILGENIKDSIVNLKNYIDFKKYNGAEYINGKSVAYLSEYEVNALLDFIYNGKFILARVEEEDQRNRQEISDLLS